MKRTFLLLLIGFVLSGAAFGQEDLPNDFTVLQVGKRVVVSWTHNFPVVKMLSVQRSYDSVNSFMSIGSPPDPKLRENGFVDANPPRDSMYYRVFVLLEGGKYAMTKSKRPMLDTLGIAVAEGTDNEQKGTTLTFLPAGFTQSRYIFTSPDRYVRVELPMDSKKYDIRFFTETNQLLFELKDIKEKRFKLDRAYFYKSGYVNFELLADGKIVERYKVFIPKEF